MMSKRIDSTEAWEYFTENIARLCNEEDEIACDDAADIAIYLSTAEGYPRITVEDGGEVVEDELATSETELKSLLDDIYIAYSVPKTITEKYDESEAIAEREADLRLALSDFLEVVIGPRYEDLFNDPDKFMDEALDSICEVLAKEHGLADELYRPMVLVNHENGEEVLSEYPYTLL